MTARIAFYGDDFTGSSDNLAQFHRHGLRSMLFFDATDKATLHRHAADLDVIGIAGVSRSLPPQAMAEELRPAFRALAELRPRLVQYKICSTFDSGPVCGNFGVVLDEARRQWPGCAAPVLAAVPDFARYTVFGNHFAGHRGEVFRLDRHPSMSRHPVTPMAEADLARHLAALGEGGTRLLDVLALGAGRDAARSRLDDLVADGDESIVLDTFTHEHLLLCSELIWELSGRLPVFALAAQGLAHGLGQYLRGEGKAAHSQFMGGVEHLLVLSGSCAPQTANQIAAAEAAGFRLLSLDVPRLLAPESAPAVVAELVDAAARAFACGCSVVVHTARGSEDPAIAQARAAAQRAGLASDEVARRIGQAFAGVFRALTARGLVRRTVFAGGDTSSHAMRACGAYALSILASDFRENAHLCQLHSHGPPLDQVEVLLKGGQVGGDEFLLRALAGTPNRN